MRVYEGSLKITPSFVKLLVGGKEYNLPLALRNGKFVRYNHPGSVKEVRSYVDYPEKGTFLYFPSLGDEREVFVKVERVETDINPKALRDRSTLKVYETPEKTVELFVIDWLERLKRNIEEVLEKRGQTELLIKTKKISLEDFYQELRRNWGEYEKALKGLLSVPPRLVLFDPQAGSGEAFFKVAKKYGIEDALLLGTELRDIRSEEEGYAVQTGVDYLAYHSELYRRLSLKETTFDHVLFDPNSKRDQKLMEIAHRNNTSFTDLVRAYAFVPRLVNPPYIAQGKHPIVHTTFANEPPLVKYRDMVYSGYAYVVLSHAHEADFRKYYDFEERKELTYDQVGYTNPVPDRYVVGVVTNSRAYKNVLSSTLDYFQAIDLVSKNAHALKEFVQEVAQGARELMKNIDQTTLETLLEDFSVELDAKRNGKVFPALDQIGRDSVGFYTYEEVINNPLLIELYRQKVPHLYELVKKMAKERDDVVRELKTREYNLMDERGLGILKYAGLPLIYPLDERIKGVVLSLLREEEAQKFEKLLSVLGKEEKLEIWLKSGEGVVAYSDGLVGFGRQTHVCLCSSDSRVHAILPIDPLKFLKLVNNIEIKTYQEAEDFLPFVKELIKQYVFYAQEGARWVFTEEEIRKIDEESWGKDEEKFREFCYNLYIDHKLEGRFIKDRLLKDQFFTLLRENLISRLTSMGKTDLEPLSSLIAKLEDAYKENFVFFFANFYEVRDQDFADRHTQGKSLISWLKEQVEGMNLGEEAKREVFSSIVDALSSYEKKVLEEDPLVMQKAILQYIASKKFLSALEFIDQRTNFSEEEKKALLQTVYKHFRRHLQSIGFFDYQIDFAFNSAYAMQREGKNVLLGWQQRTGKTRAALLSLVFQAFINQTASDFFVRSQNLEDILVQYVDALPLFSGFIKVAVGQTSREKLNISQDLLVHHPHPEHVFPNPFYNTRKGQIFKRGGTAVKELLENNAYAKIERYIQKPDQELLKYAQGKVYSQVLTLSGYDRRVLEGLVCYLAELDKAGELDLNNTTAWSAWLEVMEREGKRLEEGGSKALINLLSREVFYPSINALVQESKRFIRNNVSVNIETEVRPVKEDKTSEYYVLTPKLVEEIEKKQPELLKEKCILSGFLSGSDVYITKDQKAIKDFMEEEGLYGYNYGLINLSEFILMLARGKDQKVLQSYGFDIRENPNGYMRVPEKLPFYVFDKNNRYAYEPSEDRNFKETYIRLRNRNLYIDYRYEVNEENKIYSSPTVNQRPVMTSLRAYEGRTTGHDEMDGMIGQEGELRQNQSVVASLARVGKVLQLSGTADPFGYLITGMEIDKIFYYKNLVEKIINMREVKDERFDGFFEHLVRFVHHLHLKDEREEIESLIYMLADERMTISDKIENLYSMFEKHEFFQPHMQSAFDAVMRAAKETKDNPLTVPLKKFFNTLSSELKKASVYSHLSLINLLENAITAIGLTKKTMSRDFVSVANLALSDRHDVTLGNRKSFKGDEGTKMVLRESHLAELFTHYKQTKSWATREPEVGEFRVEGDVSAINFLWKGRVPKSVREAYDTMNKDIRKYRELYEDYMLIVKEFFNLLKERKDLPEIHSSSKTTRDSLLDLVADFLKEKEIKTKDFNKQKVLEEFLSAMSNMEVHLIKDEKDNTKVYEISIDFRGKRETVLIPQSLFYYEIEPSNYEKLFSIDFNLRLDISAGRGWYPEFFKDGKVEYFVKFNPVFGDFDSVVDTMSNGSLVKEYERTAREKINTFITTERVPSLLVTLGDLLKAVYENRQTRVHILVLETDSRIKEFLNRINIDFLASKGIYVERISSSSELTMEAEKLVRAGNRQVYVLANTTAVARGTDLSMLDELILAGRVLGNEGLQVLSRLEHAAKKGTKHIFLGVDGAYRYYTFGNSTKAIPNSTLIININTINRKYQEEIKHTGESIHDQSEGVIIPLSKQAQRVLEEKELVKPAIGL